MMEFDSKKELADAVIERRSKTGMEELAAWVDDDPERFLLAWELMESGEDRASECAAWMVFHCLKRSPNLLVPFQQNAYTMLKKNYHDAVHRTLLTGLTEIEIEEDLRLPIFDLAIGHIDSTHSSIALRCHSIFLAWSIAEEMVDLHPELAMAIETNMPHASAGFKNRGRKVLKKIEQLDSRS